MSLLLLRRAVLVFLVVALVAALSGCANTLEAVGGTSMVVGGGAFVVGLAPPATRNCDSLRTPCYDANNMQVHGEVTTYYRPNVPLMIAGGAVAAAGAVLYFIGRSQRETAHASPPAPAAVRHAPAEDDPESALLR